MALAIQYASSDCDQQIRAYSLITPHSMDAPHGERLLADIRTRMETVTALTVLEPLFLDHMVLPNRPMSLPLKFWMTKALARTLTCKSSPLLSHVVDEDHHRTTVFPASTGSQVKQRSLANPLLLLSVWVVLLLTASTRPLKRYVLSGWYTTVALLTNDFAFSFLTPVSPSSWLPETTPRTRAIPLPPVSRKPSLSAPLISKTRCPPSPTSVPRLIFSPLGRTSSPPGTMGGPTLFLELPCLLLTLLVTLHTSSVSTAL
jgi:hypothetical protein